MSEQKNENATGGEETERDLGLAGRMAQSFIHSPLSPLLLLATLAIGILGVIITPRQEDPQISVPMVDIFVQYPGVPSEQVASLIARPLERLMSEISGVDNVYSVSHRGESMVTVQFDVGEEMESSIVKVHDKLMSNRDLMPPGVSEPMVKPKGVDDVPIVTLTLWSHEVDDAMLRQIALDSLQYLNEVPNTSQSFVVSGREEKVRIEVSPERLTGLNVTMDQVAGAVQGANAERTAGAIEIGGDLTPIRTGAFLRDAGDIERLLVTVEAGRPVFVRDVADVIYGPSEVERFVRYYTGVAGDEPDLAPTGAAAATIAIAKREGTNAVPVANGILERLELLKGQVIPDNVEVSVTRNYGETANAKVNELMFKLFIATAAVTVLVFIFLGLRAALVVLVVIPVVLLFTIFSAWLMGYTIDRVSLFALIFAIGILVDDAIVVVENIYRRWLMKRGVDTETTVDAVAEVGNPTILATFTVIAALLPMGFVTGMMGPYMQPIPALGSVAMLFSLVAAFLFTPWLAWRLRPSMAYLERAEAKEHKQNEMMGRFFSKAIPGLVNNRTYGWSFLIGIVVVFFLMVMLFFTKDVSVKMLPLDNKPEFNVVINFPEGTALTETGTLTHDLATVLRQMPEVTAVQAYVGTASPFNFNGLVRHYYLRQHPWQADIQVQLVDKGDRRRTSHEIAVDAREVLSPMAQEAGARIQVVEMPPGPPVLQSVVAEIYGPDADVRRQVAFDMEEMFRQAPHLDDVDSFLQAPHDVWHFNVERDKALRRGVTVDAVNGVLEAAIGGQALGDVKSRSLVEPHLIEMRLPMNVRSDVERLLLLPVPTMNGGSVPLSELGTFARVPQDEPIYHKNLRPLEYVTAETVGRLAAPIYGMLEVEQQLNDYRLPTGGELESYWVGPPPNDGSFAFEWTGEWTVTYETFRDMGIAFAIALVLIYMLVVWEFGNFVLPGIVMAPIPLTLIGIIPGHWLLGAEFTATSMIGFIALAGIIVRNSILLMDFARHAVSEGQDVMQAMISACQARTRPILITAFALLAGSSVILFDPIFQGMAISLMFGTVVATLLTLLVIPLGAISARKILEAEAAAHGHGSDNDDGHGGNGSGGNGGTIAAMGPDGGSAEARPDPETGQRRTMTDPAGGPVLKTLGFIGLYLKSLAEAFVEGVMQSLRALARLILRLAGSGSGGGGGGPSGPAGGGGPGAGPDTGPRPSGGPGPSSGDAPGTGERPDRTRSSETRSAGREGSAAPTERPVAAGGAPAGEPASSSSGAAERGTGPEPPGTEEPAETGAAPTTEGTARTEKPTPGASAASEGSAKSEPARARAGKAAGDSKASTGPAAGKSRGKGQKKGPPQDTGSGSSEKEPKQDTGSGSPASRKGPAKASGSDGRQSEADTAGDETKNSGTPAANVRRRRGIRLS
ncbi:MAG: AcrB/AcrD/AcrF family protein [Thioalkalivibrio sp.]|nr:MAG: AcrB/AcrD/AcrF family protein [Thioalkalivibrio sp.]